MIINKIKQYDNVKCTIKNILKQSGYYTDRLNNEKRMILIKGHRRENFGEVFVNICAAIRYLAIRFPLIGFIYPMHLNPNVRKPIREVFNDIYLPNMFFIEPQAYLPFVYLIDRSCLILTDSGWIQEEAPGLNKPVLVMRDTTERPEALEFGTIKLVGINYDKIVLEISKMLTDATCCEQMKQAVNSYGDGLDSRRIANKLLSL
jgi:UDP-N-acetylglucosamine 2-epimerase (non-hydrolysing)